MLGWGVVLSSYRVVTCASESFDKLGARCAGPFLWVGSHFLTFDEHCWPLWSSRNFAQRAAVFVARRIFLLCDSKKIERRCEVFSLCGPLKTFFRRKIQIIFFFLFPEKIQICFIATKLRQPLDALQEILKRRTTCPICIATDEQCTRRKSSARC